jgi:hypothetical protein
VPGDVDNVVSKDSALPAARIRKGLATTPSQVLFERGVDASGSGVTTLFVTEQGRGGPSKERPVRG